MAAGITIKKDSKTCCECGVTATNTETHDEIYEVFGYRFLKSSCTYAAQSRCRPCRKAHKELMRAKRAKEASKARKTAQKNRKEFLNKLHEMAKPTPERVEQANRVRAGSQQKPKKESPAMQRLRRSYVRKFPKDKQWATRTKDYMNQKLGK